MSADVLQVPIVVIIMNFDGFLRLRRLLLFAAALLLLCQPAWAGNRVALVIGNSTYKNAAQLSNPVNDAKIVAATLKNAGFDSIETRLDLPAVEMRRALRDFADRVRGADVAVVYYSGHGIELEGTNYLIPTDATLERDIDIYDETFSLDRIMSAVEPARQLRLVIVDACRNNPFAQTMKRTVGSRAISRGLARIEPASANSLVAFAAKAGSTAPDDNSQNSPYATALVKHIATPGLDLRRIFGFVRDDVMKATANRQEPFVYGTLGGDDVPLVPAKEKEIASPASPRADMRQDYELALKVGNKDALNFFIAQYPDGYYSNLARLEVAKITAEEARVAAAEKARLAQQEQERPTKDAQQTQQAKTASSMKAAEEARVAADKAKEAAQEVERRRATAESAAAEKAAAEKNAASAALDRKQETKETKADAKIAALPDPQAPAPPSPAELAKSVQTELRRVGCFNGSANGEWNAESRRSLELFNRHAGTKIDIKLASVDALDAIKLKPARVCPLICEFGFRRDGGRCSKITCAAGSFLNDDNECERRKVRQAPTARRERNEEAPARRREAPPKANAEASAGSKSSGGGVPFIPFFFP